MIPATTSTSPSCSHEVLGGARRGSSAGGEETWGARGEGEGTEGGELWASYRTNKA